MENVITFGTFRVETNYTSYNVPSTTSACELQKMNFDGEMRTAESSDDKVYKVTHNAFFGENFKRALSILRKHGQ